MEPDLVVIALPGVQRFISEARSTGDVAAASDIYGGLAAVVVKALRHPSASAELVLPAGELSSDGVPNRIVALLPHGQAEEAAARAVAKARETWAGWIRQTWLPDAPPVLETPGFPIIHWVCVPARPAGDAGPSGYGEQWKEARRLLDARRRVRDFPATPEADWRERMLCSLTPRWPAERTAPRRAPNHEKDSKLSSVGWVKRSWRRIRDLDGFPSTSSIASAPYRAVVLTRLGENGVRAQVAALQTAEAKIRGALGIRDRETPVPGLPEPTDDLGRWLVREAGPWVYPERWRADALARENTPRDSRADVTERAQAIASAVADGVKAAGQLRDLMAPKKPDLKAPPAAFLTSYLAVVVQDLDNMGAFLSGDTKARNKAGKRIRIEVTPAEHARISRELLRVSSEQERELRSAELLSQPIYVGGDDLLAFTPAAKALAAAMTCHDKVSDELPHPSMAILFFHYRDSIQQAISEARRLLDQAKERVDNKHALAVGYLRRSGATEVSIQPWDANEGSSSAALFRLFSRDAQHRLSPRLVTDLDRDAAELDGLLEASHKYYAKELARLVQRHLDGDAKSSAKKKAAGDIADALVRLGNWERSPQDAGLAAKVRPQPAARVGVFLRQEAR